MLNIIIILLRILGSSYSTTYYDPKGPNYKAYNIQYSLQGTEIPCTWCVPHEEYIVLICLKTTTPLCRHTIYIYMSNKDETKCTKQGLPNTKDDAIICYILFTHAQLNPIGASQFQRAMQDKIFNCLCTLLAA